MHHVTVQATLTQRDPFGVVDVQRRARCACAACAYALARAVARRRRRGRVRVGNSSKRRAPGRRGTADEGAVGDMGVGAASPAPSSINSCAQSRNHPAYENGALFGEAVRAHATDRGGGVFISTKLSPAAHGRGGAARACQTAAARAGARPGDLVRDPPPRLPHAVARRCLRGRVGGYVARARAAVRRGLRARDRRVSPLRGRLPLGRARRCLPWAPRASLA